MDVPSRSTDAIEPAAALARIETSWHSLVNLVTSLSPDLLHKPGVTGEWSIKDLLGHIAFWDDNGAATARRLAGGDAAAGPDYRLVNDPEAANRASQSLEQVISELQVAHERMMQTLHELDGFHPANIAEDTYLHYEEHQAEVESWLARRHH